MNKFHSKLIGGGTSVPHLLEDETFYNLIAFCIMPNHIHILFKQNENISNIMQKLKGGSSLIINRLLNKSGKFWENNYYDKAIRDEKHFITTYEYIKNNPIKAGLNDYENRFYGIYE
ncbi:MAG: transposase [Campylobacterota bacterium]|nr:transposase [Campylobacterota bacterium]